MLPSARRHKGNDFVFQHDGDPKNTSHFLKNYLKNKQVEILPWPPQSPDLNPIENLWSELDRQTNRKSCKSEEDLFKQLNKQCVKMNPDYLKKLVERMPRRCEKVIKCRGYPINY